LFFAGIDIGSATTKVAIFDGHQVLAYSIILTGASGKTASNKALEQALTKSSLKIENLTRVVSTGYGRRNTDATSNCITEITAHAKGAKHLFPTAKTIIDIGGQDSKVISMDDKGRLNKFLMNDKCAAGTGRFLEVMARTLDVSLEEFSNPLNCSVIPADINSMCTVFAESEVISLIAKGIDKDHIISGLNQAIAKRIVAMAKQIELQKDVIFTGGVAKNVALKKMLEETLGLKIYTPSEPQIVGAIGAAIAAQEQAQ
jgi:(R)-2-hydroxyacyl-CoA dehydratese activating ATPase